LSRPPCRATLFRTPPLIFRVLLQTKQTEIKCSHLALLTSRTNNKSLHVVATVCTVDASTHAGNSSQASHLVAYTQAIRTWGILGVFPLTALCAFRIYTLGPPRSYPFFLFSLSLFTTRKRPSNSTRPPPQQYLAPPLPCLTSFDFDTKTPKPLPSSTLLQTTTSIHHEVLSVVRPPHGHGHRPHRRR